MTSIKRDPLLAVAKGILWFLMGVMALGAAACLIAPPTLYLMRATVMADLAHDVHKLPMSELWAAIVAVCLLAAALLAVLFRIFQLLKQIVDTVGQGDPFVPENASRLTWMAWLTLAAQFIGFPLGGLSMWIDSVTEGTGVASGELHVDYGFDANGLLLVMILFILARVFRKGAEMRAELEGTV